MDMLMTTHNHLPLAKKINLFRILKKRAKLHMPPMPTLKKIIVLAFKIILSFIIIFSFKLYTEKSLIDVVESHLQALKDTDYQKAYSYTSTSYQNSVSFDQFSRDFNSLSFVQKNNKVSLSKCARTEYDEPRKGISFIKSTFISDDNTKNTVYYTMTCEYLHWKISKIQLKSTH